VAWKPEDEPLAAGVFRGRVPDDAFEVEHVFKPFLRTAWPEIVHLSWLGLTPEAICDSLERDATETIVLDYVRAVRDRLAARNAHVEAELAGLIARLQAKLAEAMGADAPQPAAATPKTPPDTEGMGTEEARWRLLEAAWEEHERPPWSSAKRAQDAAIKLYSDQPALNSGTHPKLVQNAWRTVKERHQA